MPYAEVICFALGLLVSVPVYFFGKSNGVAQGIVEYQREIDRIRRESIWK